MFEWWARVSPRERRLASLTGVLVAISAVYFGYIQVTDRLATMDATIHGLEQDLVYYTEQMALLDGVDRAYQAVAAEPQSDDQIQVYRITARGVGASEKAVVMLQSTLGVPAGEAAEVGGPHTGRLSWRQLENVH